jgi:hypothetical protein
MLKGGVNGHARPAWVTIIPGPQDTLLLNIDTDARYGPWRACESRCLEMGRGNMAISPA